MSEVFVYLLFSLCKPQYFSEVWDISLSQPLLSFYLSCIKKPGHAYCVYMLTSEVSHLLITGNVGGCYDTYMGYL